MELLPSYLITTTTTHPLSQRNPRVEPNLICGVEPKELTEHELYAYLATLCAYNLIMEKHGRKKGCKTKLSMDNFRKEFLSGRLKVKLSEKDEVIIHSMSEEIKVKIVAHHIKMVSLIVSGFCHKFNVQNRQEIMSEGGYGLIKALWGYTNTNICFSTFAYWVVTNTLRDYFRKRHNGLSPVSKIGADLNKKIARHRLLANRPVSFDQAVIDLGLKKSEIHNAVEAQRMMITFGALESSDGEKIAITDKAFIEDDPIPDPELVEAFNTCPDLTKLERATMDAALNPWHGWMVELGRDFPYESGECRGRQHIRMVLIQVRKKIQKHYDDLKDRRIHRIAS